MTPDPQPPPAPTDRLPASALSALARAGVDRPDVDEMLAPWRWRATWGGALGAMAASGAMRVFVYAGDEAGPGSQLEASLRWVVLVVFMLLGGMLGDLLGRRRLLIGCLSGVTIATVLATFGATMPTTVFALELLAGILGAMALPLTLAVVRTSLQPRMLGLGVMLYMSGYAIGFALPGLGKLLAGWLGPSYALVPLILAAAIGLDAVSAHAPLDRTVRVRPSDWVALGLFLVAVGAIALGIQHAGASDTSGGVSAALVIGGFTAVALFFWWQGRQADPALDTRRFRERWFLAALLAGAVVSFALQLSWRAVLALLLVLAGHVTRSDLGWLVVAAAVGALAGMGASAVGSPRANGGHVMAGGVATLGLGLMGITVVFVLRPDALWLALPVALVAGGIVLGNMMRTLVIVAGVPARSAGTAAGLLDGVGYLGGMLAPLVFRPLVIGPLLVQAQAGLTALGLTGLDLAAQSPSVLGAVVAAASAMPAATATTAGGVMQATLARSLAVAMGLIGAGVLALAVVIWRAWHGHDTPLYDPATGLPRTFDDLGELPDAPAPEPPPVAMAR